MGKAAKRKKKVSVPSTAKGPVKSAMAVVKSNPFEVKVNRQKFDILGRKTKNDVGLPGVSRSKAIKKVRGHAKQGGRMVPVDVGDDKAGALSGGISAQLCCHSRSGGSPLSARQWLRSVQPPGLRSTALHYCWAGMVLFSRYHVHNTVARVVGQ